MKSHTILYILVGWLLWCLPIAAQQQISPTTRELLKKLDEVVEHKLVYRQHMEATLNEKKRKAKSLNGIAKQQAYHHIFKEYSRFQTDSATVYLNKMAQTAPFTADLTNRVLIGRAEINSVTGSYAEAEKLFNQVNLSELDSAMRLEFFHLNRTLYGWMSDYAVQPELRKKLRRRTNSYRDSILLLEPAGVNRDIVRADSANVAHNPELALAICLRDTTLADENSISYIYYNMATSYGLLKEVDKQIYYLALTAISDIKGAVTEYEALPHLAHLCYEANDIDRAYRYLICTMEDADFCKARLRTVEASKIFPIIDRAYKEKENYNKKIDHYLIYGLCSLALLLVASIIYLRRQMRRLSATRHELALANDRMKKVNDNLKMSDKVKEEYIAQYLDRCRGYIDTLENYRRLLLRRFKAHQMEELYKDLKSETAIAEEQAKFYEEFDKTFLKLYPHFVEQINELLLPEARFQHKGGELLNTELRIFALIRLGVTDSQRIAHFLDCSLATIYSYRSKLRNKAAGDKADFEKKVMNL